MCISSKRSLTTGDIRLSKKSKNMIFFAIIGNKMCQQANISTYRLAFFAYFIQLSSAFTLIGQPDIVFCDVETRYGLNRPIIRSDEIGQNPRFNSCV